MIPLAPLAAVTLAGSALLPPAAQVVFALIAVIGLGIPHGALDGELARTALRPRFGAAWFVVFSGPYLALSALVIAMWRVAPLPTLAAFLAASIWHFGAEDAPRGSLAEKLARGGLPIALPVLVHPVATASFLAAVVGQPLASMPAWLVFGSGAWLVLVAGWIWSDLRERRPRRLFNPAVLAVFLVLPPLTAFAIYFVCIHAPAHMAALVGDERAAPRIRDRRSAWTRALPFTGLTVLIGAALWPFYAGPVPARLLALTIQGLAALTLPHMVFDAWLSRKDAAVTTLGTAEALAA